MLFFLVGSRSLWSTSSVSMPEKEVIFVRALTTLTYSLASSLEPFYPLFFIEVAFCRILPIFDISWLLILHSLESSLVRYIRIYRVSSGGVIARKYFMLRYDCLNAVTVYDNKSLYYWLAVSWAFDVYLIDVSSLLLNNTLRISGYVLVLICML